MMMSSAVCTENPKIKVEPIYNGKTELFTVELGDHRIQLDSSEASRLAAYLSYAFAELDLIKANHREKIANFESFNRANRVE